MPEMNPEMLTKRTAGADPAQISVALGRTGAVHFQGKKESEDSSCQS